MSTERSQATSAPVCAHNIWQNPNTLRWVLELKAPSGTWFTRGHYETYPAAGFAVHCAYPVALEVTNRIDGPNYSRDAQAAASRVYL
jgi:hypothetical protein